MMYVLEVVQRLRPGRGKWWSPGGKGYTSQIESVGLFEETHPLVASASYSAILRARPAEEVFREEAAAIRARLDALVKFGEAAGVGPELLGFSYRTPGEASRVVARSDGRRVPLEAVPGDGDAPLAPAEGP